MKTKLALAEFAKIVEHLLKDREMGDVYDLQNVAEMVHELMKCGLSFKRAVHSTFRFIDLFLFRSELGITECPKQTFSTILETAKFFNAFGANLSTKELEKWQ